MRTLRRCYQWSGGVDRCGLPLGVAGASVGRRRRQVTNLERAPPVVGGRRLGAGPLGRSCCWQRWPWPQGGGNSALRCCRAGRSRCRPTTGCFQRKCPARARNGSCWAISSRASACDDRWRSARRARQPRAHLVTSDPRRFRVFFDLEWSPDEQLVSFTSAEGAVAEPDIGVVLVNVVTGEVTGVAAGCCATWAPLAFPR